MNHNVEHIDVANIPSLPVNGSHHLCGAACVDFTPNADLPTGCRWPPAHAV